MTQKKFEQANDILTLEELQSWFNQEVKDSTKAHELRVKDATEILQDYRSSKITGDEVMDRLHAYDRRWGEALPGTSATEGITDEMILKSIDRTQCGSRLSSRINPQRRRSRT